MRRPGCRRNFKGEWAGFILAPGRGGDVKMRWLNLVFVLLVNAVPLYGIKYLGWSIGTVLLLYWVESVLVAVFTCARIALHRALTRKSGHWRTGSLGVLVNG